MPVRATNAWTTTDGEIRVTVRNVDALVRNFFEYTEELDANLRELARVYADKLEEETYQTTYVGREVDPPWHPGYMRDHIRVQFTPSGLGFEVGWSEEDTDAIGENFYFKFWQVTGWTDRKGIFHPPVPSLQPAYEHIRPEYQQAVAAMLRGVTRRHSTQ